MSADHWETKREVAHLVKVGVTTWVNIGDIQAIEWNIIKHCPEIILGQGHVYATDFVSDHDYDYAEKQTDALIERLRTALAYPDSRYEGLSGQP
jgi:hypothetical protein